VYLHFGGLSARKGTLEILRAIGLLPVEALQQKVFIFAGKVTDEMRAEFYALVRQQSARAKILVFDEFCSYEFLNNLCYIADWILIPYTNPNQSSGVIGYAGYFHKPVIGPRQGLLGQLIRDYHLGICLEDVTAASIQQAIESTPEFSETSTYAATHQVSDFLHAIFYD
jgi:hypothetical protein